MHLIVGLGNPGRRYTGTRHNLGFVVADELASHLKIDFRAGKGEYEIAEGSLNDSAVILAKPMTMMNDSGLAVVDLVERYEVGLESVLIVCDDFQLPLGALRLRQAGTDGGHNGLYSIIYHLQSDRFPRLRCGIGSDAMPLDKSLMADFVLEKFKPNEMKEVSPMVKRAKDAAATFVSEGIAAAMNKFNTRPE
ncbi:MAG: aminoacyl-tRNA hydrolase [Bacteroidota bacterium]